MFDRLRYIWYDIGLRCIFHDLFGHPTYLNHFDDCRGCGVSKAFCDVCGHHYTLSY